VTAETPETRRLAGITSNNRKRRKTPGQNHNPRVGGSSPSSGTLKCLQSSRFRFRSVTRLRQIDQINRRLKAEHADHPYIPLLKTVPGIRWVLAFTIAAEIGEIARFDSPRKLTGYTGLCPRVIQSGDSDRRGPLTKHGPTYLRWALLEATMHALRHPAYAARYQRTKRRLGKQRGAKVAQVDIARRLAHAIWHMLTRNEDFAPRDAAFRLAA
jgi:transposase